MDVRNKYAIFGLYARSGAKKTSHQQLRVAEA